MRVSLFVALLALAPACESKSTPKRQISKQLNITNVPTGKTETCVEGDKATCTQAGGRWADSLSQCCLPKSSCALGDEAACAHANGKWTGKYCCLAPEYHFAPGDEASCARAGGAWTGTECLVK